ncbi:transcription elongation factor SPT6 [Cimex lectularius]|uniref:Transcription elongation factor SPT6 n=1 Tax=Cimex lectularius TaxID=79782 RepID=A0A8I6RW47_CIMLE|nr:transcription elongation factor SPT6 [Cimex lectularius]XP_014252443.1 transcription elongation factor SPT6 [Cimex lectularius]
MADFIDSEAEESEDEEELDTREKKKLKRLKAIDSDEEEEEDDEEKIREELKDLIDDNPTEESESEGEDSEGSEGGGGEKRKKHEDYDDRLEDEDYDLLEENLGHKIERRKRFKRLRRIEDEESEDEGGEDDGEERDAIANELFEGSDHDDDRASSRGAAQDHYGDEEDEGEYSDADDFIVDDEGRPIADKRKKRKPIFTDAALQEAQDIFGVDFDYEYFEKYGEDEYDEDEEDEDEYVDEERVEDSGRRRKQKKAARKKTTKKSIFEIYEPSELKRGHFTDFDNTVRNTDIPERMQLREVPVTPVPEGSDELDEEAEWIYKQAFCKPTTSNQEWGSTVDTQGGPKKDPQTIGKIKKALDFMRNQNFEVPFIAFYRKEYVFPELNIHDLWRVFKYDAKWCRMRSRKLNLLSLMEKVREHQSEVLMKDINAQIPDHVRVITDEDIDRLKAVQTPEELKDVHAQFLMYYADDIKVMLEKKRAQEREAARAKAKQIQIDENGEKIENEDAVAEEEPLPAEPIKHSIHSGPYAICRRAKIGGMAKRFGLKPEEFGENLRDNYQRHDVEQEPELPLVVAKEYTSAKFSTPEDVLKAAKFMVATQLSRDPLVRSCMRTTFFERATINVKPTKKGSKEIDENHPCYSLKYIKGKPVRDLTGDQYLKLHLAHQDKLINLTISDHIDGHSTTSYIEELKQLYYRDEFMQHVQEWNNIRTECVEVAMKKMLIPELIKDLHAKLLEEAKEFVLRSCAGKLYNWLKIAPYSVDFGDDDDEDWDTSKGIRVMAIAFVPDLSQASFACLIAPDGECTDYLRLPHLLKKKNSFREDERLVKEHDLKALRNFISSKRPHAIVIGGESRDALMVAADCKDIIGNLVEDDQFPLIPVEIMDNELAKIYANSLKGESDFRDYPLLLRQAISLGRRLQDPLVEFSQLCTADDEILCLRFHPLQEQISRDELLETITLEFVNRTNEVGVDINEVVSTPYCGNLVQFICGLGPRKGATLIKILKQTNQRLENRTQLVTICHMGPKVFINCAGFIKIDTNALGDSTEAYVEVLDGSRVHPETYEWARKMAVDALEYDDEDANPAGALEEILEKPEKLKDLDLDAFAEELERQSFGNKSITLYDIRSELNHRYKDLRAPYKSPSPELLFGMLTKETPETFYIGKLVTATVTGISQRKPTKEQLDRAQPVKDDETGLWQCPFCLQNHFPELSEVWSHFDTGPCTGQAKGVRVRLDNGVTGYIHIKNLSDKHVTDPTQRVTKGQLIHCRIIKVDVERFSIEASCKSSVLADKNHEWRPQKDPFYDLEAEAKDMEAEDNQKKNKQKLTYIRRVIVHPSFHNISYVEAEKLMATMEQGEVIVRPSSKGADHLTVTWKVADNIYQHIDVREEGKENAFSLGQSLWIGNEEFEDLDEIIARHVNPMASCVRDIFNFKYYKDTEGGLRDKAEAYLKEEKRKNPTKIHYIISVAKNYPGKFLLSYLPRERCKHEYITVTPNGFRFRSQVFDSVNSLFRWFKEHFQDPVPGTPSTPRSNASIRTSFSNTPGNINMGMNAEAIQRVAQNMPSHMLHSLSQVASHTPYAHTPAAYSIHQYPTTPYTPSGQTPFMTPYTTPRYGQMTPGHHSTISSHSLASPQSTSSSNQVQSQGVFLHPGSVTPSYRTPSQNIPNNYQRGQPQLGADDWRKAAQEWIQQKRGENTPTNRTPRMDNRGPSRQGMSRDDKRTTPRYNDTDSPRHMNSPRFHQNPWGKHAMQNQGGYEDRYERTGKSPRLPPSHGKYDPFDLGTKSPRFPSGTPRSGRSTPRTINSPHSMSLGDSTPLYDEN